MKIYNIKRGVTKTLVILVAIGILTSFVIKKLQLEIKESSTDIKVDPITYTTSSDAMIPIDVPEEKTYEYELINEEEIISSILYKGTSINPIQGININSLQEYNSSTIGAMGIPGTAIYYPICSSSDDKDWLDKNFSMKHSYHGTIFLDCNDKQDFSSDINILYGHNMGDGSMFAGIKKYVKREGFMESNPYLFISTKDKIMVYTVVCADVISDDDVYYRQTEFDSDSAFEEYKNKVISESTKVATDLKESSGNLFELVTCNTNNSYRVVVFFSKAFEISNPLPSESLNEDSRKEIEDITSKNDDYFKLFSNIIGYYSTNYGNYFYITDKNICNYLWTNEELGDRFTIDGLQSGNVTYINGYGEFTNGDIKFSVENIDGVPTIITSEGSLASVKSGKLKLKLASPVEKEKVKKKNLYES